MNFDLSLQGFDGTTINISPGESVTYHLHTIWKGPASGATDQCGADATGLHYDPDFKCGGNSEARDLQQCEGVVYNCSPDNADGCERGDLSGKYGALVFDANGAAYESVNDDTNGALDTHFVHNNAVKDHEIWSSIVFHTAAGGRVMCCGIEQGGGGAGGDPHFHTWAGKWYEFMGGCDLHLLKAPYFDAGKELLIDIRTKVRYGYSFIESAVVKVGEETLEVSSFGQYALNGVSDADLFQKFAGYQVIHSQPSLKDHKFEIQITDEESIVLSTFKDMVSVKIVNAETSRFHDSVGMMGAFENGLMVARNGKTEIEDPEEFAAEWQVRGDEPMLFSTVSGPQYPQKCQMPNASSLTERTRRLGESIAREAAEKACAHWTEATRDACVFDILETGDFDLANAGAY